MGFFQSLKDDLSTAMNELINDNGNYDDNIDDNIDENIDSTEAFTDALESDQLPEYLEEEVYDDNPVDNIEAENFDNVEGGLESDFADEEAFDPALLDLVMAEETEMITEVETEEPRSARDAINSLKNSGKRLEQKQLQDAIESGEVDEVFADVITEQVPDTSNAVDIMDVDVAAMLDKIDFDALESMDNANAEASNAEASNVDAVSAVDANNNFAGDDNVLAGQMNIEDLLKDIEASALEEEPATEVQSIEVSAIEAPVVEEPIIAEPINEEPVIAEPVIEEPAVEELVVEEPAVEAPVVEAPVVEEIAIQEPEIEESIIEEPFIDPIDEDLPVESDVSSFVDNIVNDVVSQEKVSTNEPELMPVVPSYVPEVSSEFSDETAIITKGMRVVGNVQSNGNMDVFGTIVGDINIVGKLSVSGTIVGKSTAHEIFADGAEINGDINVTGTVKVGQSSVILGNISSTSAVIAGAVKGDIDVQGPVVLDSSAIVMGNIKSMSVQINNGAVIEGLCSQCYAQVNPTSFFDDFKKTVSQLRK